jgi:hypothetical protein
VPQALIPGPSPYTLPQGEGRNLVVLIQCYYREPTVF